MPKETIEVLQEEVFLAEANIVRAKQKERSLMLALNGLSLDEAMDENLTMELLHEEKILAKEDYIMKRRVLHASLEEEAAGRVVVVNSREEFFQILGEMCAEVCDIQKNDAEKITKD